MKAVPSIHDAVVDLKARLEDPGEVADMRENILDDLSQDNQEEVITENAIEAYLEGELEGYWDCAIEMQTLDVDLLYGGPEYLNYLKEVKKEILPLLIEKLL